MSSTRAFTAAAASAFACFLSFLAPTEAQAQPFFDPPPSRTVRACQIDNPPPDCAQGNRWVVDVSVRVPNGAYVHVADPGCMNDATGQIARVLSAALAAAKPELALFSGPLGALAAGPVDNYFRRQGGDIGKFLSPYAKNGALCAPVVAVIPAQATYLGWRLLAANYGDRSFSECPDDSTDCPIGWSKWQRPPVPQANGAIQTVTGIFMNWDHLRVRFARLLVFYEMPQGSAPATRM